MKKLLIIPFLFLFYSSFSQFIVDKAQLFKDTTSHAKAIKSNLFKKYSGNFIQFDDSGYFAKGTRTKLTKYIKQYSLPTGQSGMFLNYNNLPYWHNGSNWLQIGSGNEIDLFIVAGQSNAVGHGSSGSSPIPISGTAYQYYSSALSAAVDPVGNASTGSMWPQFAVTYYQKTHRKICFVPTAVDGSALFAAADVGYGNWSATGALRATSVTNTNNAVTALQNAGYTVNVVGILWSQGEADAVYIAGGGSESGAQYTTELQTLHTYYQSSFPKCRMFVFQTGTRVGYADAPYATIRTAQVNASLQTSDIYLVFADAVNFPTEGYMTDIIHYNQTGLNKAGLEGANSVLNAMQKQQFNLYSYNGNIGIENTLPTFKLDITGTNVLGVRAINKVTSANTGNFFYGGQDPGTAQLLGDRLGGLSAFGVTDNAHTFSYTPLVVGYAEANWTGTSAPTYSSFFTCPSGVTVATEKMRLTSAGNLGIGILPPASKLHLDAGNATASALQITAGTTTGQLVTDGFHFKLRGNGVGVIDQKENHSIYILANGNNKLWIDSIRTISFYDKNGAIANNMINDSTSHKNLFFGLNNGTANTSGSGNTFLGYSSGIVNTTGYNNTFVGSESGKANLTGYFNNFSGRLAGYTNYSGYQNVFNGMQAGYTNYSGYDNVFLGYKAGFSNNSGHDNIAIGSQAGYASTSNSNIFIGNYSGLNSIGYNNVMMGYDAGRWNVNGYNNVYLGTASGYYNTSNNNVFVGYNSGYNCTGSGNIFIGYQSAYHETAISNKLIISSDATVPAIIRASLPNDSLVVNATITKLNGDLKYNRVHGVASVNGSTYTPSLTQNVPLKMAPGMSSIDFVTISFAGDSITSIPAGDYSVRMYGAISANSNDDFRIDLKLNGSNIATSYYEVSTTGTANKTPISYEWYLHNVTASSHFALWITNTTNNDDPVISRFKIFIDKMPE